MPTAVASSTTSATTFVAALTTVRVMQEKLELESLTKMTTNVYEQINVSIWIWEIIS